MNGELFGLAVQGIGRKRRSSLLLFAVLLLSFAFAIISLTVTGSIRKTNEEYRYDTYGTWYGAIPNGWDVDEAFLRGQAWLDGLGITKSYGTIQAAASGSTSIGTMDEAFLTVGRIGLQDGRFPESAGEIAIEADLLSALGYDYTLGQEITFTVSVPAGDRSVNVERTFTLCGVLREYAGIWLRIGSGQLYPPLNSAMITPEAAEELFQSAQEIASETVVELADGVTYTLAVSPVIPQYHFTVTPGSEETAVSEVNRYLLDTEHPDIRIAVNKGAFADSAQEEEKQSFLTALILVVTVLSVVCIYAVRIQEEARQLAVFRSIGITKRQLCVMLLYETLCLGVPAMVLGTGIGALGTWALLRLAVYSGSAPVQVVVPPALLAAAAGLWLVGVLAARLAVFLVALRAPLTGRFHVARKKARRYRNLQRALIVGLSALLCAAVIFTALESVSPFYEMNYWNGRYDYWITQNGHSEVTILISPSTYDPGENLYYDADKTVPKQAVALIDEIPGITLVRGYGSRYVRLDFDGREDVPLANDPETSASYANPFTGEVAIPYGAGPYDAQALYTGLFVVDADDWEDVVNFQIDMDRFLAGDVVLMSFPVNSAGRFVSSFSNGMETYTETGIVAGDTVTVTIGTPEHYAGTQVEVGGFTYPTLEIAEQTDMKLPYTVICSEAFLEKLLASLGPGTGWNEYRQGDPYGYARVVVYADSNAGYLSTDAVLAELVARENLIMYSEREYYDARAQQELQSLILIFTGGGCIALMALLILGNTFVMEAERQKKSCGILQAIGMSRRQLRFRQIGSALLRGAAGILGGFFVYGWYCVSAAREQEQLLLEGGTETGVRELLSNKLNSFTQYLSIWEHILLLTAVCIGLILAVSWLANRRLTREDLMAKLRDEH